MGAFPRLASSARSGFPLQSFLPATRTTPALQKRISAAIPNATHRL
ncbi:MAG: hypothetical protein LBQ31_09370 [Bacteroidales bacterium]|nr:hypothetical protein [Bacteroidales bacterium]